MHPTAHSECVCVCVHVCVHVRACVRVCVCVRRQGSREIQCLQQGDVTQPGRQGRHARVADLVVAAEGSLSLSLSFSLFLHKYVLYIYMMRD